MLSAVLTALLTSKQHKTHLGSDSKEATELPRSLLNAHEVSVLIVAQILIHRVFL